MPTTLSLPISLALSFGGLVLLILSPLFIKLWASCIAQFTLGVKLASTQNGVLHAPLLSMEALFNKVFKNQKAKYIKECILCMPSFYSIVFLFFVLYGLISAALAFNLHYGTEWVFILVFAIFARQWRFMGYTAIFYIIATHAIFVLNGFIDNPSFNTIAETLQIIYPIAAFFIACLPIIIAIASLHTGKAWYIDNYQIIESIHAYQSSLMAATETSEKKPAEEATTHNTDVQVEEILSESEQPPQQETEEDIDAKIVQLKETIKTSLGLIEKYENQKKQQQ